MSFSDKM